MSENQAEWLSPEEYQIIIGPSLKVAAELAASRGDPTLFKDLPSMLCLMYLVNNLKDYYVDEWAMLNAMSSEASLQKAAEAACMMVLTEGNVDKAGLASMVSSLNRAYQQVEEAKITKDADVDIKRAWEAIKVSQHEQFLALLEQAAKKFVIAFDGWEKTRHG
ncbi:MAG: hypothetical protein ACPG4B_04230 [Cycloclasticus sp.]